MLTSRKILTVSTLKGRALLVYGPSGHPRGETGKGSEYHGRADGRFDKGCIFLPF